MKKREFKPVYMLTGDEPYYIDRIADYAEQNILTEDEQAFNLTVVYGKDTTLRDIILAAKRFPMMSEYQVIIVKEAQNIKDFDDLQFYLQQPQPSTILVFCYKYGKLDGRKKSTSVIAEKGVLFTSSKIYDNEVPAWVTRYVTANGLNIDIKSANLLADFLGTDLTRIAHEIDKLKIVLKSQNSTDITPDVIERNIGISKEFNEFELTKALGTRDVLKANRIVEYFCKNINEHPNVKTLSAVFNYFAKLLLYHSLKDKSQMAVAKELSINPFFVKEYADAARNYPSGKVVQIISDIRTADARSKGFGNGTTPQGEILKELIFRILH